MAEYIEREAFIAEQRHLYCENCARRKGMKNGKMKFVYAIGEVPCRACDIGDMLDSVEDYPAADVVPVVRCGEWVEENTRPRSSQFYCSVCHRTAYDPQPTRSVGWVKRCRYHYCPNCGAKMDIPAEEGE